MTVSPALKSSVWITPRDSKTSSSALRVSIGRSLIVLLSMRLLSWLVSVSSGGSVCHPVLRRLETFSDEPLRSALKHHEKCASTALDLEEKVAAAVKNLKERGLVSPYLRSFVVARINPLDGSGKKIRLEMQPTHHWQRVFYRRIGFG